MHYDFIAIADADVPQAVEPFFQHVLQTYTSEANKTMTLVPDRTTFEFAAAGQAPWDIGLSLLTLPPRHHAHYNRA
jgi:hypothetical protein